MIMDTSERGLESLIVRSMTGRIDLVSPPYVASETSTPIASSAGWLLGDPKHYDRGVCVDLVQFRGFVKATQPELVEKLSLETDTPTRRQFLARSRAPAGTAVGALRLVGCRLRRAGVVAPAAGEGHRDAERPQTVEEDPAGGTRLVVSHRESLLRLRVTQR